LPEIVGVFEFVRTYLGRISNMKKFFCLAALAVAGFTSVASADPLMTYNYLDAAYQWTYIDEDGVDNANGLDSKLSYTLADNFAFEGGYAYSDNGQSLENNDAFRYGGAGWYSYCNGIDFVGRVGGIHTEDNVADLSNPDQNGVYAGFGVRSLITETFEGNADITYDRVGTGNWTYGVTGLATVAENVALKVGGSITNDSNVALLAGVRLGL
jgi:hypothetical protein